MNINIFSKITSFFKMFNNVIKSSIKLIALNPSLALFFILFLLGFNFIIAYIFTAKTITISLALSLCAFLLVVSFASGWLGLIKNIVKEEKACERPFSIFLEEIGKNIIPIAIALFVYFFIMLFAILITGEINFKIFGNPDAIFQDIITNSQNPALYAEYLKNLTDEQKFTIYGWQLSIIFISAVINYIFLFYPCAIYDECNKNIFLRPFSALKKTLIYTFKNFFATLTVFFAIGFLNLILMIANQLLSSIKFGGLIFIFLYIYFAISIVVLIFNYYEKNNCSNRCDSVGENCISDKISEEN